MTYALKDLIEVLACPRKWVARRVHGLRDPKSPWQQRGIDAHAACERFVRTGDWGVQPESETGRLAQTAVGWSGLTPPLPACAEVDVPFRFDGHEFTAHLDALSPDWSRGYDWKFSGSREHWHSDATIGEDLQTNWQSYAVMQATGLRQFTSSNVYVDPKAPTKPHPATCTLTYAQAEAHLVRVARPAIALLDLFSATRPAITQVPHDPTACVRPRDGKVYCFALGQCRHQPAPAGAPTLVQLRTAAGVQLRATPR